MKPTHRLPEFFLAVLIFTHLSSEMIGARPGSSQGKSADQPNLSIQLGHTILVSSAAISSDVRLVATGGDGGAILWDLTTQLQIRRFLEPSGYVASVCFSPDNKLILTGSTDRTARLWDVETGQEVRRFIGHTKEITAATFSADGKLVLTAGDDQDNTARLWDAATGKQLRRFTGHQAGVTVVAFSPDARFVLTGGRDKAAFLWDTSTGKQVRAFVGHTDSVSAVKFSPDGHIALTASADGVRLWEVSTGSQLRIIKSGATRTAAFSTDGRLIATGRTDDTLHLWNVETGAEIGSPMKGHKENVVSVTFSKNDQFLLTASFDGTARLWATPTGNQVGIFQGSSIPIRAVSFSPNGKYLLTGGDRGAVELWDLTKGRVESRLRPQAVQVQAVAFSPDSSRFAVAAGDTAAVWDIATGKVLQVFRGHRDRIWSLAFSPKSGKLLLTASGAIGGRDADNSVRLWDVETGKLLRYLADGPIRINAVAFSPDEHLALIGSWDGSVCLAEVATGRMVKCTHSKSYVSSVAFSSDGNRFLTGHTQDVYFVSFGLESGFRIEDTVDTGTAQRYAKDNMARLWDTANRSEIRRFDGHSSIVESVAFSPDGKQVLTASGNVLGIGDNTVRLFDVESGKEIRRFEGHTGFVFAAVFSPSGRQIVSASADGTTRLWDPETGKELCQLVNMRDGGYVVVSPSGRFDTDNLEEIRGLHWIMPDDPFRPLPMEIFMRDYYEPRLLPRILSGEKFSELPSLTDLNRVQPKIEKITLTPQDDPGLVTVKVRVSSGAGPCVKDGRHSSCESGVYDLRLYRDGQLVGQSPSSPANGSDANFTGLPRQIQLARWRETSAVRSKEGVPLTTASGQQEIDFTNIRLPRRSDVSQVEFTAYAFNEDRVKSATSQPTIYSLAQPRPGARRRAYVIAVGVDATSDPSLRLAFAPNGARQIERLLKEKLQSQYEVVTVPLMSEYREDATELTQDLATKSNLQATLRILSGREVGLGQRQSLPNQEPLRAATPDDLVLLYVASHGYADQNGKFYIVPSDIGDPSGVSEQLLNRCLQSSDQSAACVAAREFLRHSISSDELTQWLETIDAGQMVLILDSCHSAAVSGPGFKPGPMGDRGFGQLSYDKGMLVLAATQPENVDWGTLELGDRSLLTYALTQQQIAGPAFDLKRWLEQASIEVPVLYKRFVAVEQPASSANELEQTPVLFDFSRKHSVRE